MFWFLSFLAYNLSFVDRKKNVSLAFLAQPHIHTLLSVLLIYVYTCVSSFDVFGSHNGNDYEAVMRLLRWYIGVMDQSAVLFGSNQQRQAQKTARGACHGQLKQPSAPQDSSVLAPRAMSSSTSSSSMASLVARCVICRIDERAWEFVREEETNEVGFGNVVAYKKKRG